MSFFTDAAVFYPIGMVMDRYGRKWAAVPCLSTLALGLLLLPLTSGFGTFLAIAFLTGVGNGFGAGINMTLGADFAPDVGRGEFLGVWRLLADVGQAGGPAIISVITGVSSLAAASVVSGGIGFAGAVILLAFMPETLKKTPVWCRSDVPAHVGKAPKLGTPDRLADRLDPRDNPKWLDLRRSLQETERTAFTQRGGCWPIAMCPRTVVAGPGQIRFQG